MSVCAVYSDMNCSGSFDANDDDIGTGIAGAPACGDVMKLQVRYHCRHRWID